ncbi:MAG TPA: Tellurite resistance protein TerB [Alphaproteobacteria bacterium]|nr:Tellurite resistance protein TerB [Alphaproteobacteria bacterium]HAJ46182.1 Tellurite resistance protein TerB [Alphaproteobacteria bacterium]
MTGALTPQSALIYVMVVVSASDARMSDEELHTIGHFVRSLPAFDGFDEKSLIPAARECALILQETNGLEHVLAMVSDALPAHLYETAYLIALDVALADSPVVPEESRVLQRLRAALHIDPLIAAALSRAARARHARL